HDLPLPLSRPLQAQRDFDLAAREVPGEDPPQDWLELGFRIAYLDRKVQESVVHAADYDLGGRLRADRPAGATEPGHALQAHSLLPLPPGEGGGLPSEASANEGEGVPVASISSSSPKYCMS